MNLSIKFFILAAIMLFPIVSINAQQVNCSCTDINRHDLRISYSDGLTLGSASFWGMGLSDALTGTKRSDEKSTGIFSIGYRYHLSRRFNIGMDLGLAKVTSKISLSSEQSPSIKEKELNFLVLPTAEFVYFRRNLFELYGAASLGVDFTRNYETGLNEKGKELAKKTSVFSTDFAYQFNPIGLRIGNNKIGGFIEAGLGYRGFVTAGLSMRF